MRKLLFVTALLALATACPKVERKVYTFDLKARTGVLKFENIITDAPESENNDFMDVVNQVIRGTKLEEENPGWNISKKELFENEGRLDGRMEFTFADTRSAGLYQHDAKSGIIWCASRDEEEVVVSTNGRRLDDVLPGCVAWDRKATKLEITVRTATLSGGEKPLTGPFKRWSAGEELELSANPLGGMEGFADSLAGGLATGMADTLAPHASLTVGPPEAKGVDQALADAALPGALLAGMKMCLVGEAVVNSWFTDTLIIDVAPDATIKSKLKDRKAANADELASCLTNVLADAKFVQHTKSWSIHVPLETKFKAP